MGLVAMPSDKVIEDAYALARQRYAAIGVDTDAAIGRLAELSVSLHCWQGDDVGGFEHADSTLGDGLAVTGSYPGKARTPEELRGDFEAALRLIPGRHRINLHAMYAETGGQFVDRDALEPAHFQSWIDWAKERGLGIDFNPTYFSHPMVKEGATLSHPDAAVRQFWIRHGIACRRIGAAVGEALGTPCVTNIWIPDGQKDTPIDRRSPRQRLAESLDAILAEPVDPRHNLDAVESKLFGIGSESYVVGSHEFYLGYAASRGTLLCLDAGHFHPTETIADKIPSVLMWVDRLLLHVSRGVRWDSDHVVVLTDDVRAIAEEVVRGDFLDRVHFGLDYFDASINRVAAWVIGTRALLKAVLLALLEPTERLRELELAGDYTSRLAMLEELKSMPSGPVWDAFCQQADVPVGPAWLDDIRKYETETLAARGGADSLRVRGGF